MDLECWVLGLVFTFFTKAGASSPSDAAATSKLLRIPKMSHLEPAGEWFGCVESESWENPNTNQHTTNDNKDLVDMAGPGF